MIRNGNKFNILLKGWEIKVGCFVWSSPLCPVSLLSNNQAQGPHPMSRQDFDVDGRVCNIKLCKCSVVCQILLNFSIFCSKYIACESNPLLRGHGHMWVVSIMYFYFFYCNQLADWIKVMWQHWFLPHGFVPAAQCTFRPLLKKLDIKSKSKSE